MHMRNGRNVGGVLPHSCKVRSKFTPGFVLGLFFFCLFFFSFLFLDCLIMLLCGVRPRGENILLLFLFGFFVGGAMGRRK